MNGLVHASARIGRGLAAAALLIGVVAVVPTLLVGFVGWPLPESIPSLTAITEGARSGVPDEVLINTLAILGWLAWMQLALTVIIEAVALLRNVSAPALPGLPGMQLGIGRLLVTAALLLGGLTNRNAPTPLATVPSPTAAEPIALVLEPEPPQAPATTATANHDDGLDGQVVSRLLSTTYDQFFAVEKYGRGFAELGVVPQVRLERL